MIFNIKTLKEWDDVITSILPEIKHPILLLKGNLGAGKTTFTQSLVKQLGSNDEVSSPTYSLVHEYHCPKGIIYHFDFYRLKNIAEVYDLGIDEYLDSSYLTIIEWPEIYESELKDLPHHSLSIENNNGTREIKFK